MKGLLLLAELLVLPAFSVNAGLPCEFATKKPRSTLNQRCMQCHQAQTTKLSSDISPKRLLSSQYQDSLAGELKEMFKHEVRT